MSRLDGDARHHVDEVTCNVENLLDLFFLQSARVSMSGDLHTNQPYAVDLH